MRYKATHGNIRLRYLTHEDVLNGYQNWMNDPDITKYLETRFQGWSQKKLEKYIDTMNDSNSNHLFGIINNKDQYIGNIKLGPIDQHHKRASIGIMIGDKNSWGHGFGFDAIQAIKLFAFNTLNLEKLTAGCYSNNEGSKKLFLKSGFKIEGNLVNHIQFNDTRINAVLFGCSKENHHAK